MQVSVTVSTPALSFAPSAAAGLAGRSCSGPSGASRAPAAVVTIAANRWSSPPAVLSSSEHSSTARRPLRCSTQAPREARSVMPISFADALFAVQKPVVNLDDTRHGAQAHEESGARRSDTWQPAKVVMYDHLC